MTYTIEGKQPEAMNIAELSDIVEEIVSAMEANQKLINRGFLSATANRELVAKLDIYEPHLQVALARVKAVAAAADTALTVLDNLAKDSSTSADTEVKFPEEGPNVTRFGSPKWHAQIEAERQAKRDAGQPYKVRINGVDAWFTHEDVRMTSLDIYNWDMAELDRQIAEAKASGKPLPAQLISMARNNVRRALDRD